MTPNKDLVDVVALDISLANNKNKLHFFQRNKCNITILPRRASAFSES